jgi:hypothetical protein
LNYCEKKVAISTWDREHGKSSSVHDFMQRLGHGCDPFI